MSQPPAWPTPQHAPPPYGSVRPPYPMSPQTQPPRKPSRFWLIVTVLATTLVASCTAFCGYEVYEAHTPEGKRQTDERHAEEEVQAAVLQTKVANLRAALPAPETADVACPPGTKLEPRVPVVDTIYLDELQTHARDRSTRAGTGAVSEADLAASSFLRTTEFSDDLLTQLRLRNGEDAGPFALLATGSLDVAREDHARRRSPSRRARRTDGRASGLHRRRAQRHRGSRRLEFDARPLPRALPRHELERGEVRRGVRLKMHGIPGPSMGGTEFEEAVKKDFQTNVTAAWMTALVAVP